MFLNGQHMYCGIIDNNMTKKKFRELYNFCKKISKPKKGTYEIVKGVEVKYSYCFVIYNNFLEIAWELDRYKLSKEYLKLLSELQMNFQEDDIFEKLVFGEKIKFPIEELGNLQLEFEKLVGDDIDLYNYELSALIDNTFDDAYDYFNIGKSSTQTKFETKNVFFGNNGIATIANNSNIVEIGNVAISVDDIKMILSEYTEFTGIPTGDTHTWTPK